MRREDKQDVSLNEQKHAAVTRYVTRRWKHPTAAPVFGGKSVRILIKQTIRGVLSPESCVGAGGAYINARPHNKVYKCLSTQYAPSSEETHRRAGMLVASAPRVAFI